MVPAGVVGCGDAAEQASRAPLGSGCQGFYVIVHPGNNQRALAAGVVLTPVLLIWGALRLLQSRRRKVA
jgi:hypothetical protein